MSFKIEAYLKDGYAQIEQLSIRRPWVEESHDKFAYLCTPVTTANQLGWGISFPEDISFVWDGEYGIPFSNHVKILKGDKFVEVNDSNMGVTFNTGLHIKTEEHVTTLIMPTPNEFFENMQGFTTLLSTSFYTDQIIVVYKILKPNEICYIKAGTPVATIVPLSLSDLNNSEMQLNKYDNDFNKVYNSEYLNKLREVREKENRWAGFYKKATDHLGNKIGKHEVSNLVFKTVKVD